MPDSQRRIAAIATGQLGAFTSEQAEEAGISKAQLRGWIQSNRLDKAGFRTYRSPLTPRTMKSELADLLLDMGESWACGPTAGALGDLDGFVLKKPFHILLQRGRNVQRVGVFVHTTKMLPLIDRAIIDDFPVTTASRTLIDLAATTPKDTMEKAIAGAFRDGSSTERFLIERIIALSARGRSGPRQLMAILERDAIVKGRRSWLEQRFLDLLGEHGLPTPQMEVVLTRARDRLVRVDCLFTGTNVVVELLGYRWHRTKEQLQRDTERLNQLQLDGFLAFQFTYDDVVSDPRNVIEIVRTALGLVR